MHVTHKTLTNSQGRQSINLSTDSISEKFRCRGFLAANDPLISFERDSAFSQLDEIGAELPTRLQRADFRHFIRRLNIPLWPANRQTSEYFAEMMLYYLRLGFLASAYINQVGYPAEKVLPANIAIPLTHICSALRRPPILSYDAYALHNWYRLDWEGPIALGNIDTIQNFVPIYDEHWFILVHVEIEAIAARILDALAGIQSGQSLSQQSESIDTALDRIAQAIQAQITVLRRIPEKMDPGLYFKTFRPYIRFFENVRYEGVTRQAMDFRGETGAQSSIMPLLQALMKIPHQPSILINHLQAMRQYMPMADRTLIEAIESWPSIRELADRARFNAVLEAMAVFREVHYGWAEEYINSRTDDPLGTGGTPYMQWLKQLIDETRDYML